MIPRQTTLSQRGGTLSDPPRPYPQGAGVRRAYPQNSRAAGGQSSGQSSRMLRNTVSAACILYFAYAGYQAFFKANTIGALCGTVIIACAILPAYLWVSGRAKGYPIMPLFTGTYAYAYGAQFLTNTRILLYTPSQELIFSAFVLTGFLLLTGAVWFVMVRSTVKLPTMARTIGAGPRSVRIMMILFTFYALYSMAEAAGWTDYLGSLTSTVRSAAYGFGALSTFTLCYLMGENKLEGNTKRLFWVMFVIALMAAASSLILIHCLTLWFLSLAGFVTGARRVPWRVLICIIPILVLLQYGKYSMRAVQWETQDARFSFTIKPWEYPAFYARWLSMGFTYSKDKAMASDQRAGLLERASLLQMFLMIQEMSPRFVPFMHGESYQAVASGMLPRFFFPGKISPLESTNIISIHYGLQSREDTATTTLGWGLFNEAYANFGVAGTMGLAVAIGVFFGWGTRYTMGYPLLSARGLFAIIMMNNAFESEFTSATFVSCIFQSVVALLALSAVAMKDLPIEKDETTVKMSPETLMQTIAAPRPLAKRPRERLRRIKT